MIDDASPRAERPADPPASPPSTGALSSPPPSTSLHGASRASSGWLAATLVLLALLTVVALAFAWQAERRVRGTEKELVRRQEEGAARIAEANLLARQAQEGMREALAKVALVEARLGEVSMQRGQLEELIQSVARSRDEGLAADIEASLRAAQQQSALTGSAEPLVAALKQSDERLARVAHPRLEPVRRAIARDLERSRAAGNADVATLTVRLDEAVRAVDELPLLSAAEPRREPASAPPPRQTGADPAARSTEPAAAGALGSLQQSLGDALRFLVDRVWSEVRSLVRVTRIDHPEAMLMAPDQAFFLKENLKLRLLNARLALFARQFDAAQADLRWAEQTVDRYFDRSSRRTQAIAESLRQIGQQVRQVAVPRADETFAAIAAAGLATR